MNTYIVLNVKIEPQTFGQSVRIERVLVNARLVDCVKELEGGCEVLLGAGLGTLMVSETFDELREVLR